MGRSIRSAGLLAALAVIVPGAAALAQQNAPAPSAQPDMTQLVQKIDQASPATPPATAGATAASAPAASASAGDMKSNGDVTGYGYSDKPPRAASAPAAAHSHRYSPRLVHHANEVVAMRPGFEMLADGGSRLFVQLSKSVDVEQAKGAPAPRPTRKGKHARANADESAAAGAASTLSVTMRGTEVRLRVNELALETMHFNTPVVRATLVPVGSDLQFVIHLRADVAPNVKVVPTKDNGAMLQIDFPAGTYLPPAEAMEAARGVAPASTQARPDTLAPEGVNNSASETE